MINTVIYDFDGTIMNTNDVVRESWKHAYRTIYGEEMAEEMVLSTFGETLMVSMARIFPHMDPEDAAKIYRDFQEAHKEELVRLFPGTAKLVKEVKEKGYKSAIVTSRMRKSLVDYLTRFDLMEYIDVIVTCDDTLAHKPDPEPLNIALRKLQANPEESIIIGDSWFDILCGKNANCHTALVSWAEAIGKEVMTGDNPPDYFIEKPEDLFQILAK